MATSWSSSAWGDGTFGFPVVGNLGNTMPLALAAADVDLDGKDDLVVAAQDCGSGTCGVAIEVLGGAFLAGFLGGPVVPNGSTVQRLDVASVSNPPVSVTFGRLNGDAIDDVAVVLSGAPGSW